MLRRRTVRDKDQFRAPKRTNRGEPADSDALLNDAIQQNGRSQWVDCRRELPL